ncbi:MAG: carbamoyltransferase HypF, partial [Anaerolineae bacterium]
MAGSGREEINLAAAPREARRIRVAGIVQGVGFRPFVYNLAREIGLTGWVLNHSGGVDIVVEGPAELLERFVEELQRRRPPLALIASLQQEPIPYQGYPDFTIRASEQLEGQYQLISPDVATCPDCLRELFDPADRRYRYPFINCTNCGPRFTIIADIPYDRPNTTMRVFPMCPDCQREYDDPTNRRFHAQPNACPVCGPHIWLTDAAGRPIAAGPDQADTEAVLKAAKELLLAGRILAIKGLGGFHLACDATNPAAVELLRQRKRRPAKPFAIMLATLEEVRRHCRTTPEEEALLTSIQRPIVLLERREGSTVALNVAPGHRTLGVMLAYTPLHPIVLREVGRPRVMTSGNLSEEPIACDNEEALRRLGHLADAFLLHNRDIYSRYDDSVWQAVAWEGHMPKTLPQPIRRARGYAPFPITLPFAVRSLLAVGPELKNTFCLTRDRYAFLSQHIGDMENLETLEHFTQTLDVYRRLFRLEPQGIVHDLHPDYMTTGFAREYAGQTGIPILGGVQHHHAHIAACLADNGWTSEDGEVIGAAMDGTGYGEDGRIWGGE